ncbi:hypothetical protein [Calothrix sp. PCC 6303]|jgi:hypothetical protein|uniref:hypothetical protein n=1 Tax=Calothrix sp. PCC 6303 TaxID=1170562 RepID=UPI0002A009A7|nr:hypothetical protein [Calothrix sp. PCC 6303]AFZ01632.1 hypothetical protein Cal6303_2659 [Calothrix sp. PCC 6303]
MLSPFSRMVQYENLLEDFAMPYSVFGSIDRENLLEKYKKLSNKPTHYLETRYQHWQW